MKTTIISIGVPLAICLLSATFQPVARDITCSEVKSLRIRECGDATLEVLNRQWDNCDIASRLLSFSHWMDSLSRPCSTIVGDLKTRFAYFEDTVRFPIDLSGVSFEGPADAPVRIVLYVSLSCPVCKWLYCSLSDSLKAGRINEIALYVKPFAVTPLERVFAVVQKERKQNELFHSLALVKERVTQEMVLRIADSLGISRQTTEKLSHSKAIADFVASSHSEAVKNGVTVTPTVFINGKRYHSYKNPRWVIDAAEFELGRIAPPGNKKNK
jgi:hypothetical protein